MCQDVCEAAIYRGALHPLTCSTNPTANREAPQLQIRLASKLRKKTLLLNKLFRSQMDRPTFLNGVCIARLIAAHDLETCGGIYLSCSSLFHELSFGNTVNNFQNLLGSNYKASYAGLSMSAANLTQLQLPVCVNQKAAWECRHRMGPGLCQLS